MYPGIVETLHVVVYIEQATTKEKWSFRFLDLSPIWMTCDSDRALLSKESFSTWSRKEKPTDRQTDKTGMELFIKFSFALSIGNYRSSSASSWQNINNSLMCFATPLKKTDPFFVHGTMQVKGLFRKKHKSEVDSLNSFLYFFYIRVPVSFLT